MKDFNVSGAGEITLEPFPNLHILFYENKDETTAYCLDFSITGYGKNKKESLIDLIDSFIQFLIAHFDKGSLDNLFSNEADPSDWSLYKDYSRKGKISVLKNFLSNNGKETENIEILSNEIGNKILIEKYIESLIQLHKKEEETQKLSKIILAMTVFIQKLQENNIIFNGFN